MKKFKWVKPGEFKQIKATLETGLSVSRAVQIFERSSATIGFIKKAKSFEDYKRLSDRQPKKKIEPKNEDNKTVGGVMVDLLTQQNRLMLEQNKILISIDSTLKLARKGSRLIWK